MATKKAPPKPPAKKPGKDQKAALSAMQAMASRPKSKKG